MLQEKKLLFIITSLAYGGAETQLVHLAIQLKARGWEVQVVSLTPPKAYVEVLETAGISVSSLEILRKFPDPRPILRLARLIQICRPQIVHGFMVHANLLARLVRPIAPPIPVLICSARNTNEGGRFRELLYRLTDILSDFSTQVSQAGLERYVSVGAVPKHKICYIPNGVDTERFRPDTKSRKQFREALKVGSDFTWLAVGRFDIQKDYPNMLRAFARVAQERSDTMLIIVGDGPLRPEMEMLARDLGLKDRVRFLGIRRDIRELMNAADAYVMSSAWEGMANVLLEASAARLPIVATDVGGNREVVHDGETGFLVPLKEPNTLSESMIHLMDLSEGARWRMGIAGRQYIENNYSLDRVTDMWEGLYWKLLSRKGFKRGVH